MPRTPVVIGVDFSGVMTRGASWVRSHIAPKADIVLVHATEHATIPPFLRSVLPPARQCSEYDLRKTERLLEEWRDAAGMTGARVVARVGRADEVMRSVATEYGADLTVIGAHGGRERPWMLVGTTTERLLRTAETSLLVVRGPLTEPPRTILVAVDDAGITSRMLAAAGALADRLDARLHAVHVISNAAFSHALSMEAARGRSVEEEKASLEAAVAAEALRWLTALWQNTASHGKLEIDVPHGVPANEILRIADRIGADLIVIGRYGVGRVLPAVLGSVVGSVVHGAACPVLIVADAVDHPDGRANAFYRSAED